MVADPSRRAIFEALTRELQEEWSVTPERLSVEALVRIPLGTVLPAIFLLVAAFLLSPAASYVTGVAVAVDSLPNCELTSGCKACVIASKASTSLGPGRER